MNSSQNSKARKKILLSYVEICKDCRVLNNLRQSDVANAIGLSTKYVSRIETGREVPSLETLIALCAASKVSRSTVEKLLNEYLNTMEWD